MSISVCLLAVAGLVVVLVVVVRFGLWLASDPVAERPRVDLWAQLAEHPGLPVTPSEDEPEMTDAGTAEA